MAKTWNSLKEVEDYINQHYQTWVHAGGMAFGAYQVYVNGIGLVKAVVNDAGQVVHWIKGTSVVSSAAGYTAVASESAGTIIGTTSTVEAAEVYGDVIAPEIYKDITLSELGMSTTAAGTVAGDTVAALTLTPKSVVLTAILGTLGFVAGYDLGQKIVDEMMDGPDQFDWRYHSVGGKIITYLTRDGRTYLSQDLVESMRDWLDAHGYLASGFDFPTGTTTDWTEYPVTPLADYLPWYANAAMGSYEAQCKALAACVEYGGIVDLGGIAKVIASTSGSGYGPWDHTIEITTTNTRIAKGYVGYNRTDLTFENPATTKIITYTVHQSGVGSSAEFTVTNRTVEDTTTTYISKVTSSNLSTVNVGTLGKGTLKPGATAPTHGTPLSTTFPTWYGNRKYVDETGEHPHDKTEDKKPVLPVRLPYINPEDVTQNQYQDGTNSDDDLDKQADSQDDLTVPDDTANADIGTTPDPTSPTSAADDSMGFVRVYNPTKTQLTSFSHWLWTSNWETNLPKLFQDPFNAIISLHMIYATPSHLTGVHEIRVGNLNTQVSSDAVDSQYIDIDCGSLTIGRYYGSVLDYLSTDINLFLPFVGIVRLSPSEVMGKQINIKATVDVLTGTLLYRIIVAGQLLYTYSGNCAVQLPLTGANYSGIISGVIGLVGAGVATAVSGGSLAPVAIGAAANLAANSKVGVQHSGNIGANAGAMGNKKPYLIITRNVPYNPDNYQEYYGKPSNTTVRLSEVHGYTKVKDINISGTTATASELTELKNILNGGIIL